jgi:hypothetical protein
MARTGFFKPDDLARLRGSSERHAGLTRLRTILKEKHGMREGRARQFVERLIINVFIDLSEKYHGDMSARLTRILKLRDQLAVIYDRVGRGGELGVTPQRVESIFREMAKEMEALKSPTQTLKDEPLRVRDDLVSRTIADEDITARPRSEPAPPEGFGDVLEQPGVQERSLIGPTQQRRKERGIDVHQYQEALDTWSRERLAAGDPDIPGNLFLDQRPPADARYEFEVTDPKTGKEYRMDAVDFDNGVIYEIKSDAPGQSESGQTKLDKVYRPLMDQEYPRPGGWKTQVVRYDRAVAEQLLYGGISEE